MVHTKFLKICRYFGYPFSVLLLLLSGIACESRPIELGDSGVASPGAAGETAGSVESSYRGGFVFDGQPEPDTAEAQESSSEGDRNSEVSALGVESAQVNGAANAAFPTTDGAGGVEPLFDGSDLDRGESCERLLLGPPRGLACLHCLHPKAQGQAEIISSILLRSCLKNVALNYLVDGTFSFDESFLMEQIRYLSDEGRNLSLVFYLGNGPAQRRYSSTRINGFGAKISPEEFRGRIHSDPGLQAQYQRLVSRLIPVIRYARQNRARVYLVPMLEDNLDDSSFEKLFELTLDVLGPDSPAAIVRNPCGYVCYDGNSIGLPDGVGDESHIMLPPIQSESVIVTNDGRDYRSPAKGDPGSAVISLADLSMLRDAATQKGIVFILWDAGRQGLSEDYERIQFALPQDRTYKIPSFAEQEELISFLRGGL